MEFKMSSEQIIQKYKDDEQVMIRLYVQWCKNNELDAMQLYQLAYPEQQENSAIKTMIEESTDTDEIAIDDETMLDVLQLFGNDDLAFILAEVISRLPRKQ